MSSDPDLQTFVALSSALTGFPGDVLAPEVDPIGLAPEYLDFVRGKADATVLGDLLAAFQKSPDTGAILADPTLGPLARRIMRLWYLANWYTSEPPQPTDEAQVVSMNGYRLALAWTAIQAHAMGDSEMHYGYWAKPPQPLPSPQSPNPW